MLYLRINLGSTARLSPKGGTSRASTVSQAPLAGPSNHPGSSKSPSSAHSVPGTGRVIPALSRDLLHPQGSDNTCISTHGHVKSRPGRPRLSSGPSNHPSGKGSYNSAHSVPGTGPTIPATPRDLLYLQRSVTARSSTHGHVMSCPGRPCLFCALSNHPTGRGGLSSAYSVLGEDWLWRRIVPPTTTLRCYPRPTSGNTTINYL
jgi:hypothetical protein